MQLWHIFTAPRQIRRKLFLDCSISTVDCRLQEARLFGRVARHQRDYKPAELLQRLSFAHAHLQREPSRQALQQIIKNP